MRTDLVLFTRDLRVHDHPALAAACAATDRVVPLFVLDERILGSRYAAPNRVGYLLEALHDLRGALQERDGELFVRRGDLVDELVALAADCGVGTVHLSADHSRFARDRVARLRRAGEEHGFVVEEHPGVTAIDPDAIRSSSGGEFRVFTPYWRRWEAAPRRDLVAAPDAVHVPGVPDAGVIPTVGDLVTGERSPRVLDGGEDAARRRLAAWFDVDAAAEYDDTRDHLDAQTSRLSADLHFGCLSPAEIEARVDRRRRGHDAFVRQLCWREFNTQLLAANPTLPHVDLRSQDDRWREDDEAFEAWTAGRTGYPVVDAGMRQLRAEGWMHNRVRLLTASFLTKHLYVDWRRGAWHFMDWLVDGDLANNFSQWQWVAGTGTDSRPNRVFNPVTQGQRYDPDGHYVRRWVPELAEVDGDAVHAPHPGPGRAACSNRSVPTIRPRWSIMPRPANASSRRAAVESSTACSVRRAQRPQPPSNRGRPWPTGWNRSTRTGTGRSRSSPIPTTWSGAPPAPSPAGRARARTSATCW